MYFFWKKYSFLWPFPQPTRCTFWVVWQFSISPPAHLTWYGKLQNHPKSTPDWLWKRLIDFLPACHKGLHDHLRSVMWMHFWRFFYFFEFFWIFWVNWTTERSPVLKKNQKKFWCKLLQSPPQLKCYDTLSYLEDPHTDQKTTGHHSWWCFLLLPPS